MTRQAGKTGNIERAEERLDRLAAQLNRFFTNDAKPVVLRTVGRAREEAEDIWAEAQTLRRQERPVMRRGLAYGLAGVIRASERIKAAARGAAEGARSASYREGRPDSGSTDKK